MGPSARLSAHAAIGEQYAVSAGCREAASAALECLKSGGNVVDAAIAGSAVLCVVLPHAVTIGGDLFALVKLREQPMAAVNASGAAPHAASIENFAARGLKLVPLIGPLSIQTPGLVAGWQAMAERWVSRPMAELLAPAIAYARGGFDIGERLARCIGTAKDESWEIPGWREVFAPQGRCLGAGERFVQPGLARTLERIAAGGAAAFYTGPVARDMARSVRKAGGVMTEEDLQAVRAVETRPLSVEYGGLEICTQPPISQGAILLRALGILQRRAPDARALPEHKLWTHAARALRTAFRERLALLGDDENSFENAVEMIAGRVLPARYSRAAAHDGPETTTLSIMDAQGNAVSIIQSVFADLGSGVIARESGVLFNNRLSAFFLDPSHPNHLAAGRRTMHTLHSFVASDADGSVWAGGSPGGDNQPQVNLQLLARLVARGEAPAAAVEAPRWAIQPGTAPNDLAGERVLCEPLLPKNVIEALGAAGFAPVLAPAASIGSAKVVGRVAGGKAVGAWSDRRRDGAALAA